MVIVVAASLLMSLYVSGQFPHDVDLIRQEVKVGMTQSQVWSLAGPPSVREHPRGGCVHWVYFKHCASLHSAMIYFDQSGRVVAVE